jgi:hypothetical protein
MGGSDVKVVLRGLAAVLTILAVAWLALWYFIPAPPKTITLGAGINGGAFEHFGKRYRDILARHHVNVILRFSKDGPEYISFITNPKSDYDAAFWISGLASVDQLPYLVSLGRINYAPLWIFYRGEEPLDRLTQLKGKRVQVSGASLPHQILAANGVNADNTTISRFKGMPDTAELFRTGAIDAAFLPPFDMNSPGIQLLLHDPRIRLMNVAQAEALTKRFPSLNRVILPQGVIDLEKNVPASDVNLIASSNSVVVRKELHPDLVYLLAQTMQEVHGGAGTFQKASEFPTQIDPELPVAEEAVDFYRNGPSFLHRYLPFRMINYAKRAAAILVAAIAIVIPVFTYTPRLYAWLVNLRLLRLYRRLRLVNARLKTDLNAEQVAALQTDLDHIDRAANILPLRHSDLFFALQMHIRFTRMELGSRLPTMPG